MIASLSMYDRPETAEANDRLWKAIRSHLTDAPRDLTRDADVWSVWQSPELMLAQTCGMPYRTRLHHHVRLVATPDYGLPGCPPGYYNSVLVAHHTQAAQPLSAFDGASLAYNEAMSQSGWAAPFAHFTEHGLKIGPRTATGAHRESAQAVAEQQADIAAVDALTWALIQQFDDFSTNLTEIARTAPTPALPFITAPNRDPEPIRCALSQAVAQLSAADRGLLRLKDIVFMPAQSYLNVPTPPQP
ncbi:PhnD/SsuA/transferrin family substrate-binding protein [Shimia sp.]|uniref:phosphate/phosphite/phosphonate ABC transporter substrate-binding protein n=1 Tax=Shimia sp. TaxID=1954381 RepID=UPI0032977776